MIPSGLESFSLDSALQCFFLFEDIEGDSVEDGEVLRGVACPFSAEVFSEAHV